MNKSIDSLVQEVLEKKLSDGSFEQIIGDKIDEAISSMVKDALSWNSPIYKDVKDKIGELMCRSLERSNFDDYTCKLTEVFNTALKNTNLFNYKTVLNNLNELLDGTKDITYGQQVKLEDIFERYNKFIETYYADKKYLFDSSDIEEDFESEHGYTSVFTMINIEQVSMSYSVYEDYKITMSCSRNEYEPETTIEFKLRKNRSDDSYTISMETDWRISDIANINDVQIYLLKLKQNWAKVITADSYTLMRDIIEEEVCVTFTEE